MGTCVRPCKEEQLKLTEQLASIDVENSVVPSCLLMHPLAPFTAIADDRGGVGQVEPRLKRLV